MVGDKWAGQVIAEGKIRVFPMAAGPGLCLNGFYSGMGRSLPPVRGPGWRRDPGGILGRMAIMSKLLNAALTVVILSLIPGDPVPAATATEYGGVASQNKVGSRANSGSGSVAKAQKRPKKKKAKF